MSVTLAVIGGLAGMRGVGTTSTQEFSVTADEKRYIDTVEAMKCAACRANSSTARRPRQ